MQLEATSRKLFLWQQRVEEQRERAADLTHRNQVGSIQLYRLNDIDVSL